MSFDQLGLNPELLQGIAAMGIHKPTPIQEQAIPAALEGRDLIACAQTGTGKTAAFLLPIMDVVQRYRPRVEGSIRALVVVPTRELALQIDQQLQAIAYYTPITSIPVYGGSDAASFDQQKAALVGGTEVVIATPGKLLSHLNLGYVPLKGLDFLVLDEADRMMDMGFIDDIMRIIGFLPEDRQTLLFSATMPSGIRDLTKRILKDPFEISIALSKPAEGVDQQAYVVTEMQKGPVLEHMLRTSEATSIIIFAGRKIEVKNLARHLKKRGFDAEAMHSDLEQSEREAVLLSFRNRRLRILVATNVVSRGIDIDDIDMVVNYDVPSDPEDYVHRVGRTARAARKGQAVTFINDKEMREFGQIEKLIGYAVRKMPLPEGFGPGPEYRPDLRVSKDRGRSGRSPGGRPSGGRPGGSSAGRPRR
ncbi:MAG: DEAD/DEAH box helicase [Flavobacteriales bacterium]|nr:DEAD/DEAH box helicase [Flavobacteriales bacterium]MBK6752154.1 DEAD/DEAH box helicase [Flavobacteriales bacterium]MBK7269057.1 DEAD/DEAH box helicase [Flavobacteriales bacterium]MBK7752388.1 DEAD/DEAH box helicase [Flavobacteriales bacterium]MBK9075360.1 DEAD/DEAH box helicase [Flavobacteriales bacterium]